MKLFVVVAVATLLSVSGCADEAGPIAGGWTPAARTADGVAEAEAVALDAIYREHPTRALVDSVAAETQVVAGMNYRFRVEMTGAPAFRDIFEVVVYEDLEGTLEVTRLEQLQGG